MFETELKKGNFVVSKCNYCDEIVWPPSNFCSKCLGDVTWEKAPITGKILEFSKSNNEYFCVVEMGESFRIIGRVKSGTPKIDQLATLQECGIRNNSYFFEMKL